MRVGSTLSPVTSPAGCGSSSFNKRSASSSIPAQRSLRTRAMISLGVFCFRRLLVEFCCWFGIHISSNTYLLEYTPYICRPFCALTHHMKVSLVSSTIQLAKTPRLSIHGPVFISLSKSTDTRLMLFHVPQSRRLRSIDNCIFVGKVIDLNQRSAGT